MDPITLELYRHRFSGIAEEMGITLRRTSYSPNIKERLDFSCALFDAQGRLVAQAAHIPVHLGAMPASVQAALDAFPTWAPGDVVLLNDPYAGGSHLPDITMISPVFLGTGDQRLGTGDWGSGKSLMSEKSAGNSQTTQKASHPQPNPQSPVPSPQSPIFFVASRAHHADVGGMSPGSLPLSTELYQEGIIIPPVKLYEAGRVNDGLLRLILRNVRTPDERRGDLAAQRAAHAVGERRLRDLMAAHGVDEVTDYAGHLLDYSERLTRTAIAGWPKGEFHFEDVIELVEGDKSTPVPIHVTARIADETVTFDFTGTAPSIQGSLNTIESVVRSACYYVVRCLVGEELGEIPVNSGCFAPVHIVAPLGSLVNAEPPAAVAGGNVETSQRITDVVIGALAQAMPNRLPAAGQGTMNNVTMGGKTQDGRPWAYYETIGGGMGAAPAGDGLSGAHVHMSNTLNTPVEALEMAYPLRLARYSLRRESGGGGVHRGGEGIVREYEMLTPATVTMLSERRSVPPWGSTGGDPGGVGRNTLVRPDGSEEVLPSKFTRWFSPGEKLRIETPGGGGWGKGE